MHVDAIAKSSAAVKPAFVPREGTPQDRGRAGRAEYAVRRYAEAPTRVQMDPHNWAYYIRQPLGLG